MIRVEIERSFGGGEEARASASRRLRAARERFDLDRPEETGGGPREAAFRCPPFQRGLRFRTLTWAEGGEPAERRYDYDRWSEEPRAVLMANLLLGQIGIENQSLYYWPSLLFPFLYPLGLAAAGALLLAVGTVGRIRGRERAPA